MRAIAIANQKGGCGKTTTAVNLAWGLAERDRRVLLIDLDPQGHAGLTFGVTPDPGGETLADLLSQDPPWTSLPRLVHRVADRLALVPSTLKLGLLETRLAGVRGRERRLAEAIRPVRDQYDYVLVDCPPNLGILTFNAMLACQEILVPVEGSVFSVDGLDRLRETVAVVEEYAGHTKAIWVLETCCDRRTRFQRRHRARLAERFGDGLLRTSVSRSIRFSEAAEARKPVIVHAPRSRGAREYERLAEEVIGQESVAAERARRSRAEEASQRPLESREVFELAMPDATDVRLVGSFVGWDTAGIPMTRGEDGVWRATVLLPEGEYQYRFLVDGEWKEDPASEIKIRNPFGGFDSVRVVK